METKVYQGRNVWRDVCSKVGVMMAVLLVAVAPVGEVMSQTPASSTGWVNLGLPSGMLWAECNLGATASEGYGNYYAWGETSSKSNYAWSNYLYCNGSNTTLTKYCNNSSFGYNGFTDALTTLQPIDDAVTVAKGSGTRMPAKADWEELMNNTTATWTTHNGVYGRLFTATNGNSLFLPAAGYRDGASPNYAGSYGFYWASSLYEGIPNGAWGFRFYSNEQRVYNYDRFNGFSVRAVKPCTVTHGDTTATAEGSFTWHGRTYTTSQNYLDTLTNAAGCDSVVTLHLTVVEASRFNAYGATYSIFTVDSGKAVSFSRGNLQYNAASGTHATADGGTAQGTWRFAEHQWDTLGAINAHIGNTYNGWIDLFGWGTSGWNSGAVAYRPWSTSTNYADYHPAHSDTCDLTDTMAYADWAVYNAISNGGNAPNMWRTMTGDEWVYLFNTRSASTVGNTENARYAKARVAGVHGVIVFPDHFTMPTGVALPTGINSTGNEGWLGNNYSVADWEKMEAAGCVMLPASGYRYGKAVYDVDTLGNYWSATHGGSFNALYASFDREEFNPTGNFFGRNYGQALRPVRDTCISSPIAVEITACDSYRWENGTGNTYTVSGNYLYAHRDSNNCMATDTLHLTIHRSTTGDTIAAACDSLTWQDSTYRVTPQTDPTYTLTNAAGCDSVVSLRLTINHSATGDSIATACDSLTWHDSTYTAAATPTYTYTTITGCDSIVTLHLSINYSSTGDSTATACDSLTWWGSIYSTTDAPTHTYTNAVGCDSVVTLHLTINYTRASSQTIAATDSLVWHDSTYRSSGDYQFDTLTVAGCDSTVNLHLVILNGHTSEEWHTVCDSIVWKGNTYRSSGTYYFDTLNTGGGDSTALLYLTVHNSSYRHEPRLADDSLGWHGNTYHNSGIYQFDTLNAQGCDSTIYLILLVRTEYHMVWLAVDSTMGSVSPSANNRVQHGHRFTATANARQGYRFSAWSDGQTIVSRDNPYTFVVEDDISLTALFESTIPDSAVVHLRVNDASLGSLTPAVGYYTFHYGDVLQVVATPSSGAHFVEWRQSGSDATYTTAELSLRIDSTWLSNTVTLTAYFALDGDQGVETANETDIRVYALGTTLYVEGVEGESIVVYDVSGRRLAYHKVAPTQATFALPNSGVYLVKIGQRPARRVVAVK